MEKYHGVPIISGTHCIFKKRYGPKKTSSSRNEGHDTEQLKIVCQKHASSQNSDWFKPWSKVVIEKLNYTTGMIPTFYSGFMVQYELTFYFRSVCLHAQVNSNFIWK